jgi:hypothetical protein
MAVWRLEDDCLAPTASLKIDFEGPNPFLLYQKAKGIIQKNFNITSSDYWERDFRWDTTSDPRDFFVRIMAKKGLDRRSKILAEFVMQGKQPGDPSKNGKITVIISARLITEHQMKTPIQRSPFYKFLLWLYHRLFYNRVRRGYINLCQDMLMRVYNDFNDILKQIK